MGRGGYLGGGSNWTGGDLSWGSDLFVPSTLNPLFDEIQFERNLSSILVWRKHQLEGMIEKSDDLLFRYADQAQTRLVFSDEKRVMHVLKQEADSAEKQNKELRRELGKVQYYIDNIETSKDEIRDYIRREGGS